MTELVTELHTVEGKTASFPNFTDWVAGNLRQLEQKRPSDQELSMLSKDSRFSVEVSNWLGNAGVISASELELSLRSYSEEMKRRATGMGQSELYTELLKGCRSIKEINADNNREILDPAKLNMAELLVITRVLQHHNFSDSEAHSRQLYNKVRSIVDSSTETQKDKTSKGLSEEEMRQILNVERDYIRSKPVEDDPIFGGAPYEPIDLMNYRYELPPEIGSKFDAHGISKVSKAHQLRTLNTLLTDGIDPALPFHTLCLRDTDEKEDWGVGLGAKGPHADGAFIVVGKPNTFIRDSGIAGVIVNDDFYGAVSLLQKRFPNIRFIKAYQMKDKLREWLEEAQL